jgi:hypothetical protein
MDFHSFNTERSTAEIESMQRPHLIFRADGSDIQKYQDADGEGCEVQSEDGDFFIGTIRSDDIDETGYFTVFLR